MVQAVLLFALSIGVPMGLYGGAYLHYRKLVKETERAVGMPLNTTWSRRAWATDVGLFPIISLIYGIVLVVGLLTHPEVILFALTSLVLPPLSIGIPAMGISSMRKGFQVAEFMDGGEVSLWYEDESRNTYFIMDESSYVLNKTIKHVSYIPFILETRPLLAEKRQLLDIIKGLEAAELDERETEGLMRTKERLATVQDRLAERWEGLMVAVGSSPLPVTVEAVKQESLKQAEKILATEWEPTGKLTDPALKELYALTQTDEVPADIKELAIQSILDIEGKLTAETDRQQEEAVRMNSQAVIAASRAHHGV